MESQQRTMTGLLQQSGAGSTLAAGQPGALAPNRGRLSILEQRNPQAVLDAGLSLPPMYALQGDLASIDLVSNKYKIKSGRTAATQNDIILREMWPNEYLCSMLHEPTDHKKLSALQWASGFAVSPISGWHERE